jgi:TolB-like protein
VSFFAEIKRRHVIKVALVYAIVGWVVVQVAEVTFPLVNVPPWAATLVVVLVLLGFPIALVLAWAFDITPEGVVATPAAEAPDESSPPASSLPDEDSSAPRSVSAPVVEAKPVSERSIAIMPFANMSADLENEYFSDGVTETILAMLSRVRDLKVISRTSVMRLKGTTKSVHEIASELGVAHLVEGAVQRSGDRVRITAQLIDARTDEHRWAETYDRDLEDIFAIQSDVAERIVGSLQAALTPVGCGVGASGGVVPGRGGGGPRVRTGVGGPGICVRTVAILHRRPRGGDGLGSASSGGASDGDRSGFG